MRHLRKAAAAFFSAAVMLSSAIPAGALGTGVFLTAEEKLSGWQTVDGKDYYYKNGKPVTKSATIGGVRYKFDKDGVCKGKYTGFTKSAGGRSYWKNGVQQKGKWLEFKSGKVYYAGKDGYLRTGWAAVTRGEGKFSFFDENGVWDGKTYYMGYKPASLRYFLMDYDFSAGQEFDYIINFKGEYKDFAGIETVLEALEKDLDTPFLYDELTDDEQEENENIYHYSKNKIIIRRKSSKLPGITFDKDENGDSYFYCHTYGFGCKLSDKDAFDKIKAALSPKKKFSEEQINEVRDHIKKHFKEYGLLTAYINENENFFAVETLEINPALQKYINSLEDKDILKVYVVESDEFDE